GPMVPSCTITLFNTSLMIIGRVKLLTLGVPSSFKGSFLFLFTFSSLADDFFPVFFVFDLLLVAFLPLVFLLDDDDLEVLALFFFRSSSTDENESSELLPSSSSSSSSSLSSLFSSLLCLLLLTISFLIDV